MKRSQISNNIIFGVRFFMLVSLVLSQFVGVVSPAAARDLTAPDSSHNASITGPVTLWYAYSESEFDALSQVISDAEAANPGLDIIATYHSNIYDDYDNAVRSNGGPDLFIAPNDNLGNEVRNGLLLNLDSYLTGKLTNVDQAAIDALKINGAMYGIPVNAKVVALYYNKSNISTPPTTTAELLALLQAGKKLAVSGNDSGSYFLYGFWGAFGGQLMDDTGLCIADQAGFVDAMQYLRDLQTAGAVIRTDYASAHDSFLNGSVDMLINGSWDLTQLKTALGSNLGVVLLPAGPDGVAKPLSGPDGFFVNPHSGDPAKAVDVGLYLTNQTSSQTFTDVGNFIPVRSDVTNTDPLIATFAQAFAQGYPRPQNVEMNSYWGPFQKMIENVLDGIVAPLVGVQTACSQMNKSSVRMDVWYKDGHISAYDWPVDTDLTLNIDDPSIPGPSDYSAATKAKVAPWDPNQTLGEFNFNGDFEIKPGMTVTVSGASRSKELVISDLTITNINTATNVITGSAGPDEMLWMNYSSGSCCWSFQANHNGVWSVDSSAAGPNGEPSVDIGPGSSGTLNANDDDGDNTSLDWRIPNPYIEASADSHWVHARGWPVGTALTLTIDDPSLGPGIDYTGHATMGPAPWNPGDPNDIVADFDLGSFSLKSGFSLKITDGLNPATERSYTLANLAVTGFDLEADTISGIGTPNKEVQICVNKPGGCVSRYATAAADTGLWTVDYSIAGTRDDEQETFDLQPGNDGWASEGDQSGNQTWVDWRILNPYIEASHTGNWVRGRDWPVETVLTLTIDDPSNGPDIDKTAYATSGPASWNPNDIVADFDLGGFDIKPGFILHITDGLSPATERTYAVTSLAVTGFDLDADTISGTGTPGQEVQVCVNKPGNCVSRYVTAAAITGLWTVDYHIVGTRDDEKETFDLQPGNDGWAAERDIAGSQTWVDWRILNPHIEASPTGDWIHAREWPDGTALTLTIDDPSNGPGIDLTANASMGPASWNPGDPNDIVADFGLDGLDIKPGFILHITDGLSPATERTYTLTNLTVSNFNLTADTISGIGISGQEVHVCVNIPGNCVSRYATAAAGSGLWTVNYHTVGTRDDEQDVLDLKPDNDGWAAERDSDGNQTWVDWSVPPMVSSITRADANPNTLASVHFTVTFTEPVSGVDSTDFSLTTTGLTGTPAVTAVTGADNVYRVTVNTGSGSGTLRLNVTDNDSIQDLADNHNPLGGWNVGNGDFNTGEVYGIRPPTAFNKTSPANGSANKTTSLSLAWAASSGASSYEYCIDTTNDNACATWVSNGKATSKLLSGLISGTTYYWQARAKNAGGTVYANGSALAFWSFKVDVTAPKVVSIVRLDLNPSVAASLRFTVNFSEVVTGVDAADFNLTVSGISGAAITSVSGSGAARIVTVKTGTGIGTIRLNVIDNDSIKDSVGYSLGGVGIGNGNFLTGPKYTLDRNNVFAPVAAQDGWVLETSETSGLGGTLNTASTLLVGDDALDKQYRSLLSFNTLGLPDNATIVKVTLKIKKISVIGTDPFSTHGNLWADIRKGFFSTSTALQALDFQAPASKNNAGAFSAVSGAPGWYQIVLSAANYAYINKVGPTQFRLHFNKDDNDDRGADYASFYAGEAAASVRPVLIVEYILP